MNVITSHTVNGRSMTCMQFSSSSSARTVLDNAWKYPWSRRRINTSNKLLYVEEENNTRKTHANFVLITTEANLEALILKSIQKMDVRLTRLTR